MSVEQTECEFCFRLHTNDGHEWVKCRCGQWILEKRMEYLYVDANGEKYSALFLFEFVAMCNVNIFLIVFMFHLEKNLHVRISGKFTWWIIKYSKRSHWKNLITDGSFLGQARKGTVNR